MDDLLKNVTSSFDELSPHTLYSVFLTLQGCLIEIMVKGGNNYKIPHMSKQRLRVLPEFLEVDKDLVKDDLNHLQLPENEVGHKPNFSSSNEYFQT